MSKKKTKRERKKTPSLLEILRAINAEVSNQIVLERERQKKQDEQNHGTVETEP